MQLVNLFTMFGCTDGKKLHQIISLAKSSPTFFTHDKKNIINFANMKKKISMQKFNSNSDSLVKNSSEIITY